MSGIFLRYFLFITGLYFLALGVDLFIVSSLGTTPISSVNYIISLHSPLSLGMATFVFNVLLIVIEFGLIHGIGSRRDRIEVLLQVPLSFLLGLFMDVNMHLLEGITVGSYYEALALMLAGCLVQGIGVTLEVKPNVAAMSAEGVVKYISRRYGKPFGKVKIIFDICLVAIAATLSFVISGRIEGLGEGTVTAALLTGTIVSFLSLHVLTRRNAEQVLSFGQKLCRKA